MQRKKKVLKEELTDKQRIFVAEYLIDFNSTRAAIAAGYSPKTARQSGYENLTKPYIMAEIKKRKKDLINDLGITAQRVLLEYAKIAFADITSIVQFGSREITRTLRNGREVKELQNYIEIKNWDEIDGTILQEVKQIQGGGLAVKLHDKMKALEALAQYTDLLPDEFKRKIETQKLDLIKEQHKLDKEKLEKESSKGNISALFDSLEKAAKGRSEKQGGEAE